MLKKKVVPCFEVLFHRLLGETEEIYEYLAGLWAYIQIWDLPKIKPKF
jgi:hypothetical protein